MSYKNRQLDSFFENRLGVLKLIAGEGITITGDSQFPIISATNDGNLTEVHWDDIIDKPVLTTSVNGISADATGNINLEPLVWNDITGLSLNNLIFGTATGVEQRKILPSDLTPSLGTGGNRILLFNGTTNQFQASTAFSQSIVVGSIVQRTSTGQGKFSPAVNADEAIVKSQFDAAITQLTNTKINQSQRNASNGLAPLDSNSKVPMSNMPDALIGSVNYQGNWDVLTNSPTLDSTPTEETKGHYYIVENSGVWDEIEFNEGDWIISNGLVWEKVNNSAKVIRVAGKQGDVVLEIQDIVNLNTILNGKELLSNKSVNLTSPDNAKYPTTLAVVNAINTVNESVDTKLGTKQNTLVSGTNIKTINGQSVLGTGDIIIPTINTNNFVKFGNNIISGTSDRNISLVKDGSRLTMDVVSGTFTASTPSPASNSLSISATEIFGTSNGGSDFYRLNPNSLSFQKGVYSFNLIGVAGSTAWLKVPNSGTYQNEKVMPVSVNGLYADKNGNIDITSIINSGEVTTSTATINPTFRDTNSGILEATLQKQGIFTKLNFRCVNGPNYSQTANTPIVVGNIPTGFRPARQTAIKVRDNTSSMDLRHDFIVGTNGDITWIPRVNAAYWTMQFMMVY